MELSTFIFLSVMMVAFGYIAGNAKSFNFTKMAFLGLILIPFITEFNYTKVHLLTMLVAFIVGYFLPYAYMLDGLGESISDLINALRYRDAYEDIKRKEEEVEELRRKYEQARQQENRDKQEQARQKRKEQSQSYRQSKQNQNKQSSSQNKSEQKSQKTYRSSSGSTMNQYLRILGLQPDREYSYKEIKKAYKRQASKYHPDKHHGSSQWDEMNEKFKEINEAYQWLAIEINS